MGLAREIKRVAGFLVGISGYPVDATSAESIPLPVAIVGLLLMLAVGLLLLFAGVVWLLSRLGV